MSKGLSRDSPCKLADRQLQVTMAPAVAPPRGCWQRSSRVPRATSVWKHPAALTPVTFQLQPWHSQPHRFAFADPPHYMKTHAQITEIKRQSKTVRRSF